MNASRRSILKMFGITAAAAAAPPTPVLRQMDWMELRLKPPDGMTYQWKRVFLTPDYPDFENIREMIAYGWKPVPIKRHRDQISRADDAYWIEAGGLVLMEKPTEDIPPPEALDI